MWFIDILVNVFMDNNMNSIWATKECKGSWGGSSFVNEEIEPWRGWMTWRRTHSCLMAGLGFQTSPMSSCSFSGWKLVLLAFCHCWQNILRKWRKGPKLGMDFSWFASSSSITLGEYNYEMNCLKYELSWGLLKQFLVWLYHEFNHNGFKFLDSFCCSRFFI